MKTMLAVAAAVTLSACSPAPGGPTAAKAGGSRWDAANACSLVADAEVAAAVGSAVTGHKLDGVMSGAGLATASTCFYALADGSTVSLLARKAPAPDASQGAIEAARTGGGAMPPAQDVAGLGKAALWTAEMGTLQVFIDDTRYMTLNGGLSKGDRKAALTEIARKAS